MDRAALTATSLADFQLSTERTLPVAPPLVPLLPDGALVRGRVVAWHPETGRPVVLPVVTVIRLVVPVVVRLVLGLLV